MLFRSLDTTHSMLNSIVGYRVSLKLSSALPAVLQTQVIEQQDHDYMLSLASYQALESVLAELRMRGVAVLEMKLQQPDLEDVFMQLVGRSRH